MDRAESVGGELVQSCVLAVQQFVVCEHDAATRPPCEGPALRELAAQLIDLFEDLVTAALDGIDGMQHGRRGSCGLDGRGQ